MYFSEDIKTSFLKFSFVMIYIIHKMLVFLKNDLNYLRDSIFKCFIFEILLSIRLFFKKLLSQNIMMESLGIEKENFKDRRNLFRLEKETKASKDEILRYIKNLFENEEKRYYKPAKVINFWSKNYIDYESNGDRNKTPLSVEDYLNKIRPYLKDI